MSRIARGSLWCAKRFIDSRSSPLDYATTVINYPPQARFTRQILIGAEPNRIACVGPDPAGAQIAAPGDSGSLWVTNDPRIKDRNGNRAAVPVGLLFASRAAAPAAVPSRCRAGCGHL